MAPKIFTTAFFFKSLFFFWYRFFFKPLKKFRRTNSYITIATQFKHQKYSSNNLLHRSDLNDHTLFFDVEGALLKSSSVFPYFMLVAFEAGGLIRSIVLILTYPFVCLVGEELGMKIMVMICFFGVRTESFRVGSSVLPKLLLEDVGDEIFEVVNRFGKKVGFSRLPRVMVESFLKDYLGVDLVVGREMKVFGGYFIGLMEDKKKKKKKKSGGGGGDVRGGLEVVVEEGKGWSSNVIGLSGFHADLDLHIFSLCKEVYLVAESEKKSWQTLPRNKYPKPLIFHDGRLALRPTPLNTIFLLTWVPFAFTLAIFRTITGLFLPYNISAPLLALSGFRLDLSLPKNPAGKAISNNNNNSYNNVYVCNHRTLLDPLYISHILRSKNMTAVTYSLSRVSELLSPIRTVRLTRNRDKDFKMMKDFLKYGDLIVCPEGTTCREKYLLRFSPLFSELCDEISPVAIDSYVSMFHGTTAGGLKCMDPLFFLMNPFPSYSVQVLDKIIVSSLHNNNNDKKSLLSNNDDCDNYEEDKRFEVANYVQKQIGKALGFECTKLTRRDKYLVLAGNEGIVSTDDRKNVK